jgi:putative MATE family efflux protein
LNSKFKNIFRLESKITFKDILKISLPIIAGSAVENITAIINTVFLGHVGVVQLGAVALGGIMYLIFVMLGFGLGIGMQIIVARRYGSKQLDKIGEVLHHALIVMLVLGLLFLLTGVLFGSSLLKNIVKSHDVYSNLYAFLSFRMWGIGFAYLNIVFRGFYTGIMRTRVIAIYSIILASVNVFFDYTLIFGHWGFPQMGIAGAGLSSVIAEFAAMSFFVIFTIFHKDIRAFSITRFLGFRKEVLFNLLKVASPVMMQYLISFGGWFFFFTMVENMGEVPLAVSNLLRTFYMIALLPLWGFSSATNTLVSYLIGSGRIGEVKKLVLKILLLSTTSVLMLILIINIFSGSYLAIFTNDVNLIQACFPAFHIVSLSSLMLSLAIVFFNVISGAGKTTVSLFIEFSVIIVYMAWAFWVSHVWHSSVAMIWLAEAFYGLTMGSLALLYLKYGNWKNAKI